VLLQTRKLLIGNNYINNKKKYHQNQAKGATQYDFIPWLIGKSDRGVGGP